MKPSPDDPIIFKLADAYAYAEGFFVKDSRPARNHNPGDFERDITGEGIGFDGPYVIYKDDAAGWKALYREVRLQFSGSHIYNPQMTILEVARHWTEDKPPGSVNAWAANVAKRLGVTVDTRLMDIH